MNQDFCVPQPRQRMIRGEISRGRPPRAAGQAQQGSRDGVVAQANELLRSVVLIAPTSSSARPASFRPEIEVAGQPTRVLVEQVGAIATARIGELVGVATPEAAWGIDEVAETMADLLTLHVATPEAAWGIDEALRTVLGLR
jgi:mRNA interferase MazF